MSDESVLPHGESQLPQTRRRRSGARLIDQTHTAKVIAGQLLVRAEQLRNEPDHNGHPYPSAPGHLSSAQLAADTDLADLLETAAAELRAVS